MLFVKNMMFLDGATATLAPDLDILGEIAHVYLYFQEHYGDAIAAELGLDADARTLDIDVGEGGLRPRRRGRGPAHLRRGPRAARAHPQAHAGPAAAQAPRRGDAADRSRRSRCMPELPEMQALAERLEEFARGRDVHGVDPLGFSALKTVRPGARVARRAAPAGGAAGAGKYLRFVTDGDVAVAAPPLPGRPARHRDAAEADQAEGRGGAVPLRRRSRAARARARPRAQGGVVGARGRRSRARPRGSAPSPTRPSSRRCCCTGADKRRIHTMLRDQRTVAGIGRGYADDALQRAHVSPYATLEQLTRRGAATALLDAIRTTMAEALDAERHAHRRAVGAEARRPVPGPQPARTAVPGVRRRRCGGSRSSPTRSRTARRARPNGKILADRRLSRLVK